MTVTSSPRLGWAVAPTDWIRSMTASTCSSVAVGFITIIMVTFLLGLGVSLGGGLARAQARAGELERRSTRGSGADTAYAAGRAPSYIANTKRRSPQPRQRDGRP